MCHFTCTVRAEVIEDDGILVLDGTVLLLAGAEAGREEEQRVLTCESILQGVHVGSVPMHFVHGNEEGRRAWKVE